MTGYQEMSHQQKVWKDRSFADPPPEENGESRGRRKERGHIKRAGSVSSSSSERYGHESIDNLQQSKSERINQKNINGIRRLSDLSHINHDYENLVALEIQEDEKRNSRCTIHAPTFSEKSTLEFILDAVVEVRDDLKTIKSTIKSLESKVDYLVKKVDLNATAISELKKSKERRVTAKPDCLPFKNMDDLIAFEESSQADFEYVVAYLIFLGGLTPFQCATLYIKESFDERNYDFSKKLTWSGTLYQRALKKSRFAQACIAAMNENGNFNPPTQDQFKAAMTKELKNQAERSRKRSLQTEVCPTSCELHHCNDESQDKHSYKHRRVGEYESDSQNEQKELRTNTDHPWETFSNVVVDGTTNNPTLCEEDPLES